MTPEDIEKMKEHYRKHMEIYNKIKILLKNQKKYSSFSEAGGLLVGNDEFGMIIPNEMGDGRTQSCIIYHDSMSPEDIRYLKYHMDFFSSIKGRFNIYNSDCSNRSNKDILYSQVVNDTEFGIYTMENIILFIEWKD